MMSLLKPMVLQSTKETAEIRVYYRGRAKLLIYTSLCRDGIVRSAMQEVPPGLGNKDLKILAMQGYSRIESWFRDNMKDKLNREDVPF